MKKLVLVVIIALFLSSGVYCSNNIDLTAVFYEIIGQYWEIQTLRYNNSNIDTDTDFIDAIDKYHDLVDDFCRYNTN